MSSLTTTTVRSANGTTNLTLATGNTDGAAIVVTGGTEVFIRANTTANVFNINASSMRANVASVALTGNLAVTSTINATSFNLGTPSIATSGHTRLPNGLLMQWGTVTANLTSGSITFPTTFAANPYTVILTSQSTGGTNTAIGHAVTAVSTTTATVRTTNATSYTFYYSALGV